MRWAKGRLQGVHMRKALERKLVDRWPGWFNVNGDIRETLMPYGFSHVDGWFDLVWRLCERLEPAVAAAEAEAERAFQVIQVKEKLGAQRFYTNLSNQAISDLILDADRESSRTCEICGAPGNLRGDHWLMTRCDEHAEERVKGL